MPKLNNEGINQELPQDIQSAHSAVMGYTRSGLWVKVGKIVIASSLVAIIIIYLISRIFAPSDAPAISPLDPNGQGITNGVDGTDGKDGEDGADGEKGDDGAQGPQGPMGPQGPQGPAGTGGSDDPSDSGKGEFVIALDQLQKGIAISETRKFNNVTPYLYAPGLNDCWNITYSDIPEGIDNEEGGTKNGTNYLAYTFFLTNNSPSGSALDYNFKLRLKKDNTGAIDAIRFQLYEDGVSTIYGAPSSSNNVEPFACDKSFTGDVNLLDINVQNFRYNQVKRYTIVLWYEGYDPECVDNILPASIDMSMHFEVLD